MLRGYRTPFVSLKKGGGGGTDARTLHTSRVISPIALFMLGFGGVNGSEKSFHDSKQGGDTTAKRRQDPKYVIMFCPNHASTRHRLFREVGTQRYQEILSTEKGLRAVARWVMREGLLGQFSLARGQLDRAEKAESGAEEDEEEIEEVEETGEATD